MNNLTGVYQVDSEPRVYIDISSISSLQDQFVDENLVLGAGLSIQQTMTLFEMQMKNEDFSYLKGFHKHLELVANVPVKNVRVFFVCNYLYVRYSWRSVTASGCQR